MDGVSKYPLLTNSTMFNYIVPVKCNAQILNCGKYPAKGSGIVILKVSNIYIYHYTTMAFIMYAPKPTKYSMQKFNQTLQPI